MHVLVLDDDEETRSLIDGALRRAGYEPVLAADLAAARAALEQQRFPVAVFDIMLAGESGLDFCQELRRGGVELPILFLSARGTVRARLDGFEAGGDDYLAKPFAIRELVARVRALAKRSGAPLAQNVVRGEGIVLDFEARRASVADAEVPLTGREWDVLLVLAAARTRVVPFDDILERAWGEASERTRASMGVIMTRLRRKLTGAAGKCPLRTLKGVGYALELGS